MKFERKICRAKDSESGILLIQKTVISRIFQMIRIEKGDSVELNHLFLSLFLKKGYFFFPADLVSAVDFLAEQQLFESAVFLSEQQLLVSPAFLSEQQDLLSFLVLVASVFAFASFFTLPCAIAVEDKQTAPITNNDKITFFIPEFFIFKLNSIALIRQI
ncbi:MAG: hypothetical protein LBU57_10005 [Dysgonamonadaceae bacterium]|jgi:hypothetical protein|nr:hypothetical protein [Dysgonamonadaceae bacterium]